MRKKSSGLLFMLSIILILAACASNDLETRTFEMEANGVFTEVEYHYEDDKVMKQKTESTVQYEAINVSTKEEAKDLLEPGSEQLNTVTGVTDKIKYSKSEATELLEIDFENIDFDQAEGVQGLEFIGDTSQGISMEKSAELLLEQGFTEK